MPEKAILLAEAHLERRRRTPTGDDRPTPDAPDPTETRTPGRQTAWPHRGDWFAAPLWAVIVLIIVCAFIFSGIGLRAALGQTPQTFELKTRTGTLTCQVEKTIKSKIGTWKYHACRHDQFDEVGYCFDLHGPYYCQPTVEKLDKWVHETFRQ